MIEPMPAETPMPLPPAPTPGGRRFWRLALALALPWLAIWAVQTLALAPGPPGDVLRLTQARGMSDSALGAGAGAPPAVLATASQTRLPLRRSADPDAGGYWLEFDLPPPDAIALAEPQLLALAYQPAIAVYLDGVLLARSGYDRDRFVLGSRHLAVDIPPALRRAGAMQRLQLHVGAPGPTGARLDAPLLGPRAAVMAQDEGRQRWQALRTMTMIGGLLVGVFLALVAVVRRDEPLYPLSAAHVALLAALLSPYVLAEQPLPSPYWRMVLDLIDLAAKALLVAIAARLAGLWTPRLRLGLIGLCAIGAPIDSLAAWAGLAWSDFGHPWPWWALASRALLLALAWGYALRALARPGAGAAAWGTALLVGFSAATWAWIGTGALIVQRPVVDSNALAHAGWVAWVAALLLAHFTDVARRERALRVQLTDELADRSRAMQTAYAARAEAERERAASEQRHRLLQDLHDGLGAQLLNVRLRAADLTPDELAQALDACLLEMRLSVDALAESEGDLGVLLGGWRQRVEPMLHAAGLHFDWRVQATPPLPTLQGAGALEMVRALQEALANTIRHAQASRFVVATELADHEVVLWLVDNGIGLPNQARPGIGRKGLATRAERLGAAIAWHSPAPRRWLEVGVGTAIEIRLPLETVSR